VKGEGRRGRGRRVARAEEGALPQDSCSLGTVAPFQWRGVEASQKQEQKGVCLLRLLAFLETHVEGICWECSILGLGLVFLDAPLRRKSWLLRLHCLPLCSVFGLFDLSSYRIGGMWSQSQTEIPGCG